VVFIIEYKSSYEWIWFVELAPFGLSLFQTNCNGQRWDVCTIGQDEQGVEPNEQDLLF